MEKKEVVLSHDKLFVVRYALQRAIDSERKSMTAELENFAGQLDDGDRSWLLDILRRLTVLLDMYEAYIDVLSS